MSSETGVRLQFVKDSDKVHSVKFRELPTETQKEGIGAIYVKRDVLAQIGNPDKLTVTVERA